jgi:hypothetical protein
VKTRAAASTHKKVIVTFSDRTTLQAYVNPLRLPSDPLDLLTTNGEQRSVPLKEIRAVYFVRDFTADYEPERKAFLSRPKLDGLWVRLTFLDKETLEGVVTNDLLALMDSGMQITPPDLNGPALRIFVPRSALSEVTVLGVVGMARRKPAAPPTPAQPKLFSE